MKKLLLTAAISALSFGAMAQAAAPSAQNFWTDPMFPFYLAAAAVALLLILVMIVAIYVIRVLNFLTEEALRQQAVSARKPYTPTVSWWTKFVQKINASVPLEREKDIELDHNYDGIRELDNHLPPWWKWLFYGTIGWAAVYLFLFHVTDILPLSQEEYQMELAQAEQQIKQYQAMQPKAVIDENTLQYVEDPAAIENGKSIFINNNCGGCHRTDGGGNTIGPNLTDEYWLHGGGIKNIFLTIRNGVVEKGMPAWGRAMSAHDVRDVTYFVMSLRGSNPPDAKGPQGELIKMEAETMPDSLKARAGL